MLCIEIVAELLELRVLPSVDQIQVIALRRLHGGRVSTRGVFLHLPQVSCISVHADEVQWNLPGRGADRLVSNWTDAFLPKNAY
jgi:hypothetical protein